MGAFFSNLQIKRNEQLQIDEVKQALVNLLKEQGYTETAEKELADAAVIIAMPKESQWITVCSEVFEFNDSKTSKAYAAWLSLALHTDVLAIACFDSDYAFLNLINESNQTDAWANIKTTPDLHAIRRTGVTAWKKIVTDTQQFKACLNGNYIFAEEGLRALEPVLLLPGNQSCLEVGIVDESMEQDEVLKLYFSVPEDKAQKEPTKLQLLAYTEIPCIPDQVQRISIHNVGDASRGLAVIFWGDYVENEEITFSDVYLEYGQGKQFTQIPVELKKIKAVNQSWMYYWEDKAFYLTGKANPNLPLKKRIELEFAHSVGIRFTAHGNIRKFLDIRLSFAPLSNYRDGQCCWYVWQYEGSRKAFIEEHNRNAQRCGVTEPFPANPLGPMKVEEYDGV